MYKVFFNEQIIYVDSQKDISISDDWVEIVNSEIMPRLLFEFFEKGIDLYLYSDNPEQILEYLKAEMKYLEAAGGIVENQDEELLFIYRLGYWDLPKGVIEEGESPEKASYREIQEECGISSHVLRSKLVDTFHMYKQKGEMFLKKTHWYCFELEDNSEQLSPQTEEDIELVSWFSDMEIELALLDSYESIREVYSEYKEMKE